MKRFLLGAALGTLALGAVTFILMSANGSPLPRDWQEMIAYPTGSGVSYFLLATGIYGLSLMLTCRSPRRTTSGSPRTTTARSSAPSGISPGRANGRGGRPGSRRA